MKEGKEMKWMTGKEMWKAKGMREKGLGRAIFFASFPFFPF